MNSPKFHRSLFLMLLGISISVQAHTLSPDQYLIWGLDSQDVQIPAGSIITEAVLTIHDFVPSKARFNLHLLDNTAVGVQLGVKEQPGNIFDGFGIPLAGKPVKGNWVCQLSKTNQANSPLWSVYGKAFKMSLSNNSKVSFTSALLELIDCIGNGGGFGFGFSFTDVCSFSQITLDITAKTFAGDYQELVYSFQISEMYELDPVSGTWVYRDGQGQAEWEIPDDDPYLPLTVKKCQVTAGKIVGQDTLTVSGTFDRVPSNLFNIALIETEIVSIVDDIVIYSQDCDYTWNTTQNSFNWTYKLSKNQPGQITSLVLNFAARTFAMTASRVDLTGLSSPIRFNVGLGSYLLTGEADETQINGTKLIPIRLMRSYRDQLRVTKAAAKKGKVAGTDTLTVTGEIAAANPDLNLTEQAVIVNWGDQAFAIPAGSFIRTKNLNKYTCKASLPEGLMVCLIDLDQCLFSVKLSKASLGVRTGEIEFGMQFASFDQIVELRL